MRTTWRVLEIFIIILVLAYVIFAVWFVGIRKAHAEEQTYLKDADGNEFYMYYDGNEAMYACPKEALKNGNTIVKLCEEQPKHSPYLYRAPNVESMPGPGHVIPEEKSEKGRIIIAEPPGTLHPEYTPGKFNVTFFPEATEAQRKAFREDYKLKIEERLNIIPDFEFLIITDGTDPQVLAKLIEQDPKYKGIVKNATPEYLYKLQGMPKLGINDPKYKNGDQWHLKDISLAQMLYYYRYPPKNWHSISWKKPIIAVIDSGMKLGNQDFPYQVIVWGCDWTVASSTCIKPLDDEYYGHGTGVTMEICAGTNNGAGGAGIDCNLKIIEEKACRNDECPTPYLIQAIYHAVSLGARIINMSIAGRDYDPKLNDAIQYALARGAQVTSSAGNDALNLAVYPYYPAIIPGVMTCVATNQQGYIVPRGDYNGSYWGSNFGRNISVAAPGTSIWGYYDSSIYHMVAWEGTSFCTPIVTAALALVLDKCQTITTARAREIVETHTDPMPGCPTFECGSGKVNLYKSLAASCVKT